jgi:raffinose/stachyose/melibiose transport system substrate-binding protein
MESGVTGMNKAMKLAFTILLAATLMIGGCGQDSSPRANSESAGASDTKIELTLTDSWTATSTQAVDVVHRKLIDQFIRENPNIEISEDTLDNASLKAKIKTLAAGNNLPDLFMMLGSNAQMFLDDKLIMPVNDLFAKDPDWKNGFMPEGFKDLTFGGVITGAPMQMTVTSVVYYNQSIFRRAGYDRFPATWDEWIDALKKIKAMGITPITMGNKDQWVAGSCLLSTLGDRFTGTDWFDSIKNKRGAKFTDPPFVAALAAIKQLSDIGAFNSDINSLDNNQQKTAYYDGQAAMFLEGGWAVSSIIADASQAILNHTRLALLPSVPGGEGAAFASSGGSGWAIALNANLEGEKLDAAVKLVKLLTGKTAANLLAERGDISGSIATDYDKRKSSPLFDQYLQLLQKLTITPVYDVRLSPETIQTMNDGLQELLLPGSTMTPEILAQNIQDTYSQS